MDGLAEANFALATREVARPEALLRTPEALVGRNVAPGGQPSRPWGTVVYKKGIPAKAYVGVRQSQPVRSPAAPLRTKQDSPQEINANVSRSPDCIRAPCSRVYRRPSAHSDKCWAFALIASDARYGASPLFEAIVLYVDVPKKLRSEARANRLNHACGRYSHCGGSRGRHRCRRRAPRIGNFAIPFGLYLSLSK